MSKIKDFDLKTILPSSISQDKNVREVADAISANLSTLTALIPDIAIFAYIDRMPEKLLDALAWQFHMDIYADAVSLDQKREMVKTAIRYHRYKGTPYALMQAVRNVLPESSLSEWFDYGGKSYHFKIISQTPLRDKTHLLQLKQTIQNSKNARSWNDGLKYEGKSKSVIYIGARRIFRKTIHVYIAETSKESMADNLYVGVGMAEEELVVFNS